MKRPEYYAHLALEELDHMDSLLEVSSGNVDRQRAHIKALSAISCAILALAASNKAKPVRKKRTTNSSKKGKGSKK